MRTIDIVGNKYSALTVTRRAANQSFGNGSAVHAYWHCVCDCGKEVTVASRHLKSGHAKSCGCRMKEAAIIAGRKRRLPGTEAGFRQVLCNTKCGAKKRKLAWRISDEEARELFSSNCFYCGSPPIAVCKNRYDASGKNDFIYNGIDRVDNDEGYIPGNIVPCCGFCNRAKGTKSYEEFTAWLRKIVVLAQKGRE